MSTDFTALPTNRDRVLAFWRYVDEHNHAALSEVMTDDFTLTFLPSSLGGFGIPVRNKEQSITFLCGLPDKGVASLRIKPTEWVETGDTVVGHYHATGELVDGSPYKNEYMGIFRFRDGKMVYMKEFMDSKYISEIHS
ncbi:hypothetical protein BDQ17DRAFT_1374445 [Cyathus striatus]|nr:hypothetical protein BDQ17DRAFT_1374445 [Cyathus striatus]